MTDLMTLSNKKYFIPEIYLPEEWENYFHLSLTFLIKMTNATQKLIFI